MMRVLVVVLLVFACIASLCGWVIAEASYRNISIDPITYLHRVQTVSLSSRLKEVGLPTIGDGFSSWVTGFLDAAKISLVTLVPVDWLELSRAIGRGEIGDFKVLGQYVTEYPFLAAYNTISGG